MAQSGFHASRLFRSTRRMPTLEDASSRRFPIAELWDDRMRRRGLAEVRIYPVFGENPIIFFAIICWDGYTVTHWRWADPEQIARIL